MLLGPLFQLKENLGATQATGRSEKGAVRFQLFFSKGPDPQIRSIDVAGDLQHELGRLDRNISDSLPLAKTSEPDIDDFWEFASEERATNFY